MQGEYCMYCGSSKHRTLEHSTREPSTPALPSEPEVLTCAMCCAAIPANVLCIALGDRLCRACYDEWAPIANGGKTGQKIRALRARCAQLEGERIELRAVYEAAEDFVSTPPFDRDKLITLREKVDVIFSRECAEEDAARSTPTSGESAHG